jgi:hypothetical protein
MPQGKLIATFRGLCKGDIQFIVVGDLAAALHGATGLTYEVSLVYSLEPVNIERLLSFLEEIDAIFLI